MFIKIKTIQSDAIALQNVLLSIYRSKEHILIEVVFSSSKIASIFDAFNLYICDLATS